MQSRETDIAVHGRAFGFHANSMGKQIGTDDLSIDRYHVTWIQASYRKAVLGSRRKNAGVLRHEVDVHARYPCLAADLIFDSTVERRSYIGIQALDRSPEVE